MVAIAQCSCYCAPLQIIVLHIYTNIESVNDHQVLYSNDKKEDGVKLRNALPPKIAENLEVTQSRNYIPIAIILLYMLCYATDQHSDVLQVEIGYFAYTNNTT